MLFLGIRLLIKKEDSFAVSITNPAVIFTFLFAFSYFGISAGAGLLRGILPVTGVFTGTYIWCGTLIAVTNVVKKKKRKYYHKGDLR